MRTPGGLLRQCYEQAIFKRHPENPAQYRVEPTSLDAEMLAAAIGTVTTWTVVPTPHDGD